MKIFTKTCASLIGLVAFQAAAVAQTVSPANTAVTASGQLIQDLHGTLTTVCNVTLTGTTDATGITFTSMTGTAASGPLSCYGTDSGGGEGLVFPLRVEATSPSSVTFKEMAFSSRIGECGPHDVFVPWDNMTSTTGPLAASLPGTNGIMGLVGANCNLSGSLTISPSITIS